MDYGANGLELNAPSRLQGLATPVPPTFSVAPTLGVTSNAAAISGVSLSAIIGLAGVTTNINAPIAPPAPAPAPPPIAARTFSGAAQPLLKQDAPSVRYATVAWVWGIYRNGNPVIVPDSIVDLGYKKDYRVSNYPVEDGAFQTYNKVEMPYSIHVRVSKSGTIADRAAFLDAIERISGSLDLLDIVMPEKIYTSANLVEFDYRRTATNGVTLLTVDLVFEQIRTGVATKFVNASQATGADRADTGNVQAVTATPAQSAPVKQVLTQPGH